jgi:hypothetical protein
MQAANAACCARDHSALLTASPKRGCAQAATTAQRVAAAAHEGEVAPRGKAAPAQLRLSGGCRETPKAPAAQAH